MAVVGAAVVLGLAAAHPALRDRGVPLSTRYLLLAALPLFAAAIVGEMWDWRVFSSTARPDGVDTGPGMAARAVPAPGRRGGLPGAGRACLGVATGQLPREQFPRHLGRAVAVVVPQTLLALVLVPLIIALVGPITAAAEVVCVLGGYAWLVRRDAPAARRRRDRRCEGSTPLALLTWLAVDGAWRSLPDPPPDGLLLEPAYAVAVGVVDSGPDVESGGVLAALLLGAVLTVLACARLPPAPANRRRG